MQLAGSLVESVLRNFNFQHFPEPLPMRSIADFFWVEGSGSVAKVLLQDWGLGIVWVFRCRIGFRGSGNSKACIYANCLFPLTPGSVSSPNSQPQIPSIFVFMLRSCSELPIRLQVVLFSSLYLESESPIR